MNVIRENFYMYNVIMLKQVNSHVQYTIRLICIARRVNLVDSEQNLIDLARN